MRKKWTGLDEAQTKTQSDNFVKNRNTDPPKTGQLICVSTPNALEWECISLWEAIVDGKAWFTKLKTIHYLKQRDK